MPFSAGKAFQMEFPQVHFDLCFFVTRIGLSGGLKGVEQQCRLNSERCCPTRWVCSGVLWKKYQQSNNRAYLDTLLAYNRIDVFTLKCPPLRLQWIDPSPVLISLGKIIHCKKRGQYSTGKRIRIRKRSDPRKTSDVYHHGDFYQSRRKN